MSPLLLTLLLLLLLAGAASPAPSNGPANDLLPKYGLPRGLIPDAVESYTFNTSSGAFEIHLASPCYVQFSKHLVYYDTTVRGTLSYGAISGLSGIQAKKLFLWVSVTAMVAHPDKGTIEFQAGFVSESLPASDFDKVPVCGAGVQLRGAAGVIRELGLLPVAEA